nr:uncharacterized protein LOC120961916 [Aegilops tauschii subsp. strangulata]
MYLFCIPGQKAITLQRGSGGCIISSSEADHPLQCRQPQVVARIIWTICTVTLPLPVFLPLTTSNYSRRAWRKRICGHPSFIRSRRDASSCIWFVVNPVLVGEPSCSEPEP